MTMMTSSIPSFNDGDLAFAVDDMIEVTDTTFDEDGGGRDQFTYQSYWFISSNYVAAVAQDKVDLFLNQIQSRRSFVYEETRDKKYWKKKFYNADEYVQRFAIRSGFLIQPNARQRY